MLGTRNIAFVIAVTVMCLVFGTSANAYIVFFDDFEDETSGSQAAINTTSQGAGDLADIGGSWTYQTDGAKDPFVDTNGHLDLGRVDSNGDTDNAAIANFTAVPLDEITTIDFDFRIDRTGAGRTDVNIYGEGEGGRSFHLRVRRGYDMRVFNYDNGTSTEIFDLNNDTENRHMSLVLGESTFDIMISQLDGSPAAYVKTGLGYDNLIDPISLTSIRFEDNASNNARTFWIDNLSVAVPEPSTFVLAALGLFGLGWSARRRRKMA